MPADPAFPWERQDGEPAKAFAYFVMARDMPPIDRNLRVIAAERGIAANRLDKLSSEWDWPDRLAAWDAEQDRIRREAFARRSAEMGAVHADAASKFTTAFDMVGGIFLDRLNDPEDTLTDDFKQLGAREFAGVIMAMARAFPGVMGAERVARGYAGSQLGSSGDDERQGFVMVGGLSQDDTLGVWEALERAGIKPGG